jgi:hypothetical protein
VKSITSKVSRPDSESENQVLYYAARTATTVVEMVFFFLSADFLTSLIINGAGIPFSVSSHYLVEVWLKFGHT